MSKAILYDSTLCIGCKACEGACAERWHLPYDDKVAAEPRLSAHKLTAIQTYGDHFPRSPTADSGRQLERTRDFPRDRRRGGDIGTHPHR